MKLLNFIFLILCCMNYSLYSTNALLSLQKGYLFVFEGIDGSGKTTVAHLVAEKLKSVYDKVAITREPGATNLGKNLRTLLLQKSSPICPTAEYLLFAADRAQHFHDFVIPKLQEHYIVISDRMADSSLVYQGYVKGVNKTNIIHTNAWAMQGYEPDLTIYLKIDAQTTLQRIKQRNEAPIPFEEEILLKKQEVIDGFDDIFQSKENGLIINSTRHIINTNSITVDTDASAQDIAQIVFEYIIEHILYQESK